jgi:nitroimidazol reductase NimA-like FMN-containing flavoprotein (pyridoxamine 5'-phosphate oxidase superfamily)
VLTVSDITQDRSAVPGEGPVPRGAVRRRDRLMSDGEARRFLQRQRVAHVAAVDPDGWPYVIPLVYVYEGGDELYLHTGARRGHFLASVERCPRLCIEVSEIGPLHPGAPHACNSALVYTSVVLFGHARLVEDEGRKAWFFDRLLEKYGDPAWSFAPGYPLLHRIVLYEVRIEVLTGKRSEGLVH